VGRQEMGQWGQGKSELPKVCDGLWVGALVQGAFLWAGLLHLRGDGGCAFRWVKPPEARAGGLK